MRVLFIHPEDSPRRGAWSGKKWDLIVDLGRSSKFSANAWASQAGCPVLRSDLFRHGVEDIKLVRNLFSAGCGRMIDEEGIDWWGLVSLLIAPQAEMGLIVHRIALEVDNETELWTTRAGWPSNLFSILSGRPVRSFSESQTTRLAHDARHYTQMFRRFSPAQIGEIFLDKYDPAYKWRSRFESKPKLSSNPSVLVPSAYGNVSRMAIDYARLVPEVGFMMVATRRSGIQSELPPNMKSCHLASFASGDSPKQEIEHILHRWQELEGELRAMPAFDLLARAGVFELFPSWLRDGLSIRNAWRAILKTGMIAGVLCGDDSNRTTRLPVLLAANRNIPTVDFHHGAFDGRNLLKDLPCDVYLAKNEMERDYLLRVCGLPAEKVEIGAPSRMKIQAPLKILSKNASAILFSEPYEVVGLRAEEVYRELLPQLCELARSHRRQVIIKLHPFESLSQRSRLVRSILLREDRELVKIVGGPLTSTLLSQAWFGVTVESTTVMDCLLQRVPCFLCGWIKFSSHGYAEQYSRFGVGSVLEDVSDMKNIPSRISAYNSRSFNPDDLWRTAESEALRSWLTGISPIAERHAS